MNDVTTNAFMNAAMINILYTNATMANSLFTNVMMAIFYT
jgi:hypothetical protein